MKRSYTLLILFSLSIGIANAQFGKLKDIKSKAESNTKKEDDKVNTNSNNTNSNKSTQKTDDKAAKLAEKITSFDGDLDYFYNNKKDAYCAVFSGQNNFMPKYPKFKKLKDDYATISNPDPEILAKLKKGDEYFDSFFPNKFVPGIKECVLKQDFFDSTKWMNEPEMALGQLDFRIKNSLRDGAEDLAKDTIWIAGIRKILINQRTKVAEYKSSGGLKAHRDKLEEEKSKKIFPSKAAKQDPEIVAFVKKNHPSDYYGAIQKIIIVTDWKIEKDNLNYPIQKYVAIEIITNKDGKCYLIDSTVYMEHEGGGKYGQKKLSRYLNNQLMDCNNAK